jgi:hypothetical protein
LSNKKIPLENNFMTASLNFKEIDSLNSIQSPRVNAETVQELIQQSSEFEFVNHVISSLQIFKKEAMNEA